VNTGMNGFSGEAIVDMILRGEKKAKYLLVKGCFEGWLALREIHQIPNSPHHGRVRCVVKLARETVDAPQWKKVEWGWNDSKGWVAHQITEVRMLSPPIVVEQTNQGFLEIQHQEDEAYQH